MSSQSKKKDLNLNPNPIDLDSLKNDEKRSLNRIKTNINVLIHDFQKTGKTLNGKIVNISSEGFCIETPKGSYDINSQVMIEFVGANKSLNLGLIKAIIQWVREIDMKSNNLIIGLKYSDGLTEAKRMKIEEYIGSVINDKWEQ